MDKHDHHPNVGRVAGVCEVCGKSFQRDGDFVSISSYSSQPSLTPKEPTKVKRYADWVISTFTFCDEHIPPMPDAVREDIEEERKRRAADLNTVAGTYFYRDMTREAMNEASKPRRNYINRGGSL